MDELPDEVPEPTTTCAEKPRSRDRQALRERLLRAKHGDLRKLAEEFGVSRSTLTYYRRRLGFPSLRNGPRPQRQDRVPTRANSELTSSSVGHTVGVVERYRTDEWAWTAEEADRLRQFVATVEEGRAPLLQRAKQGDREAIALLEARYHLRLLPIDEVQKGSRNGGNGHPARGVPPNGGRSDPATRVAAGPSERGAEHGAGSGNLQRSLREGAD